MASKAPKFLLGGINKWNNFFGLGTATTGVFGFGELIIKAAPVFGFIYGVRKLLYHLISGYDIDYGTTHYVAERDTALDESRPLDVPVRRASFE